MNRHKKGKRAVEAVPTRRLMPLHEEEFAALIAAGALYVRDCAVLAPGEVSKGAVLAALRGRDYGVVGLLEPTKDWTGDGVLYVWDAEAFWVGNDDLAIEITSKLGLYPDLVVDAIPVRTDAGLFPMEGDGGGVGVSPATADPPRESASPSQTSISFGSVEEEETSGEGGGPLPGAPDEAAPEDVQVELPPQAGAVGTDADAGVEAPGSAQDAGLGLLNRIAGATCLLRHRVDDLGLPASTLASLLPAGPEGTGRGIQSFVEPVINRMRGSLGGLEFAPEEVAVLIDAAVLLEGHDVVHGIDPSEFTSKLTELAVRGGQAQLALAEKLSQAIGKLANSEIELTSARIDDSRQLGLRGLMVFLQTLDPGSLLQWMKARPDVGRGVSLIASLYSGIYAGLSLLPREAKGKDRQRFAGPVWYAKDFLDGVANISVKRAWGQDASCQEAVLASGWTLYESTIPAMAELSAAMDAARGAGFEVRVDPDSGATTIQLPLESGPAVAGLVTGRSRWVAGVDVARLQVDLVHGGRGKPTKELLESMLSGSIAPVWAALDPASSEFSLFAEAPIREQGQGDLIASALKLLVERIETLGLVARKDKTRVKSPRVRRAPKASD